MNQDFKKIAFYIVAHADDWQLFMQPAALHDITDTQCKTVFIILTAGDAGRWKEYWQAREEGMKSSIRFCLAPRTDISQADGDEVFNKHHIRFWRCNQTISLFMSLPDGGLDGKGFQRYKYQSLPQFLSGNIKTFKTLDGCTCYQNARDLSDTLSEIIMHQKQEISHACLHFPNPYQRENPGDHPDHLALGTLMKDISRRCGIQAKMYCGYGSGQREQHEAGRDLFWKVGMFAAYEQTVFDLTGYSTLKEDIQLYTRWCLGRR